MHRGERRSEGITEGKPVAYEKYIHSKVSELIVKTLVTKSGCSSFS